MLIIPTCAQPVGDLLGNLPIWLTTLERWQNLIESLDAPLRTGESAFLFQAGRSGQHNIGVSTCVAEENVLYNEKIKFFKCSAYIIRVRIDDAHLLANHVHGSKLVGVNGFYHLVVIKTRGGRKRHVPCLFKPCPNFGIIDRLVSWKIIRHRAVVARSLHIVVTTHGISPGSRSHIVPSDEKQVGNGGRSIRTLAVLGNSHRPENANTLGLDDHVRHSLESLFRQARDTRSGFHCEGLQTLSVSIQAIHPLFKKLGVRETVVEQVAADRV